MPVFATPGPVAATVQVAGARVRVTASERNDTAVLIAPVDPASRSDVRVAEKAKVAFAGGRLTVKTTVSGIRSGSVDIAIDLPAGSSLTAYLGHASVDAEGPLGECELHAAASRVRLDRVDALQANLGAGELEVGRVAGPVRIDGGVVGVRIGEAGGAVVLANAGGRTWIGHASGALDLSSGSGGFDIDRADDGVTASTGEGDIRIGRLTRGKATLSNGSGNIEVGVAEGVAARVRAESKRGSVRNGVGPQAEGGAGRGEVVIDARTRHGDVIVQRAAGR
ncbi:DUF4097 domain-containing protein [Glycomyces sp. A-F 0318]|uniref:DUF4097 family beta strand repeat-containing protein n=1 Tax=Glycomyces amatae TaxID=2881355 RepID=UPI001E6539FC|nr:DUF4097 family beta strand repeat-containing protein [Glycomyces amatae]MCD0447297.1 DUF4097 domain-containing protein [Glycomyces amatae]